VVILVWTATPQFATVTDNGSETIVSPLLAPYVQVATTDLVHPILIVDARTERAQLPVVVVTEVALKEVVSFNVHYKP